MRCLRRHNRRICHNYNTNMFHRHCRQNCNSKCLLCHQNYNLNRLHKINHNSKNYNLNHLHKPNPNNHNHNNTSPHHRIIHL